MEQPAADLIFVVRQHIDWAKTAAKEEAYDEALGHIDRSRQAAEQDEMLLNEINIAQADIKALLDTAIESVRDEIDQLLAQDDQDISLIQEEIERLSSLDPELAASYQEQLVRLQQVGVKTDIYTVTLAEIEALWAEADLLIEREVPTQEVLDTTYYKALKIAEGAVADYDTADLKGLLRRTQREYDQARQRFEILSTAAETGEYQKILDILDAEPDDSKLIPLVGPGQEYMGTKTIREAKREIREMAQSYSRRKADGYLEAARVYYEANQPVAADNKLKQIDSLFMNIDEEISLAVEGFRKNFLQPALDSLAEAESKIETAARTVDGMEAWTLSEEAEAAFPIGNRVQALRTARLSSVIRQVEKRYTAAVEPLNDEAFALLSVENLKGRSNELESLNNWGEKIIGYISLEVERVEALKSSAAKAEGESQQTSQLIGGKSQEAAAEDLEKAAAQSETAHLYAAEAEAAAEQISALEAARPQLDQLQSNIETSQNFVQELFEKAQYLAQQESEIRSVLTTNITRSQSLWNSLIETYGAELMEHHGALAALGRELDIRLNIKGLLAKLEGSFNQKDPSSIVIAIQDAERALDIPDNREFSHELTEMRDRLASRMALLIGQTHEQAGDGIRALAEYRKVSLDDKAEAEGRIKQIEKQLKRDDEILKAIEKAEKKLQTKPIKAIELIYPKRDELTSHRERLLGLLESSRQNLEVRLETSYESHKNKPFTEQDFPQIESELSWAESLGSTNNLLLSHVKGKLAESRAKKHEALAAWPDAIVAWEEAMRVDPRPSYKAGKELALKQNAHMQIGRNPDVGRNIAGELIDQMPEDAEAHLMLADAIMHDARQPSITPVEAEDLYSQAQLSLQNAQFQYDREPERYKHVGQLSKKIQTRLKECETAVEVEQIRSQIEEALTPRRAIQEFYKARGLAEQLIADYPSYPRSGSSILRRWWKQLANRAVKTLENEANQIDVAEIWRRFDPLAKILVLDEGHGDANQMLNQIGGMVRTLEQEVQALAQDRNGLSVQNAEDSKALDTQLEAVQQCRRRTDGMYATLRGISSKSSSFHSYNQNLAALNTITSQIEALQTKLFEFRYLSSQALNAANTAKATGEWLQFDEFIDQIGTLGFAEHRQTRSLLNGKDADQKKRTYLGQRVETLTDLADEEKFDEALEFLDELRDKQSGDPNDIFGIVGSINYTNPLNNRKVRRLNGVRDHFEALWAQIGTLARWLASAGVSSDLAEAFPDLAKLLHEGDYPALPDVEEVRQSANVLKDQGKFTQANYKLLQLLEDDEHGLISLMSAIAQLKKRPVERTKLDSHRAVALFEYSQEALAHLEQIKESVEKDQERFRQDLQRWEDAYTLLSEAKREKISLSQGGIFSVFRRSRAEEISRRYYDALFDCRQICPDHPDLKGFDEEEI